MTALRTFCAVTTCVVTIWSGALLPPARGQEPQDTSEHSLETSGQITAVTVYQGQALVTREIDVNQAAGLWEVVVTDLPENVMPASLYAEPIDGAEIRSVRYRVRPVQEDVREEVRQLDQKIEQLQDEVHKRQTQLQLLTQRSQYLDKLENFTATTSQKELAEGVLNAKTLTELSEYLFQQRDQISQNQLTLEKEVRDLNEQIQLLQRQRQVLAGSSARTVREAVVFANLPDNASGKLRLRYLVNEATWTPSYAVRAPADNKQVQVDYFANVQQMSGEDWNDVEMTLSTATPSLVAKAPTLEPLALRLAPPGQGAVAGQGEGEQSYEMLNRQLAAQKRELVEQRNRGELDRRFAGAEAAGSNAGGPPSGSGGAFGPQNGYGGAAGYGYGGYGAGGGMFLPGEQMAQAQRQSDIALNTLASSQQLLDLSNQEKFERTKKPEASGTEGVSVSYQLDNRTSLPSRADRQLIQIASLALEGDFYRLAIPVLTNYVYREAEVTNNSEEVLLAGPATVFVGDQFVGRGEIPTVAVGQSFTIGLGIDSSLRTARNLVKRDEQIQGGNRVVDVSYELVVENFDQQPIEVRLLDRLPEAQTSDVRVTLVSSEKPVSDDAKYQTTRRKEGILRWDVSVPAQAIGPEQFTLAYTMKLEYDKQLAIAEASPRRP